VKFLGVSYLTHYHVSAYHMHMATNLKLDDRLIARAVKIGGHKTKQAAVSAALAEYVQRRNRLRILELAGTVEFDPNWDYKKMRRGRP
jgi:Arc/MetJ family transcription regulator